MPTLKVEEMAELYVSVAPMMRAEARRRTGAVIDAEEAASLVSEAFMKALRDYRGGSFAAYARVKARSAVLTAVEREAREHHNRKKFALAKRPEEIVSVEVIDEDRDYVIRLALSDYAGPRAEDIICQITAHLIRLKWSPARIVEAYASVRKYVESL